MKTRIGERVRLKVSWYWFAPLKIGDEGTIVSNPEYGDHGMSLVNFDNFHKAIYTDLNKDLNKDVEIVEKEAENNHITQL